MKRFPVLVAVVFVLAALLVDPVCASELSFDFEMMPSVALLPEFEVPSESAFMMCYEAMLPEGEYHASLSCPGVYVDERFPDPFVIVWEAVDDDEFACEFDTLLATSASVEYCHVVFFYDAALNVTYFVLSDSSGDISFAPDMVLSMTLVGEDLSSDGSYLKQLVVDLFGPYEQQTETITQTLADGSTVTVEQRISGIAGLDYEWIASVALFALVLLSFFRLLGGLIKQ